MKNLGIGARPVYYESLLKQENPFSWVEVITENFLDSFGLPRENLLKLRRKYELALHGVGLNIGSDQEIPRDYLQQWRALIDSTSPWMISDHLCWTGRDQKNWHDLLPLPRTRELLNWIVDRVKMVQDFLGRQIALENISSYLEFSTNEMEEWNFISEIADKSNSLILLDINNVYVNSENHGFNPQVFIQSIPADRVVQYHLAGFSRVEDFLFDTHDHPVCNEVIRLFEFAWEKIGPKPYMIERDDHFPSFSELVVESNKISENLKFRNMLGPKSLKKSKMASNYV